jgi:N-acetylneuraminic acid mutarotase
MGKNKKKDPLKKAALAAKKEAKAEKAARKRLNKEAKGKGGDAADDGDEDNLDALLEVYRKKDENVTTTVIEPPLEQGFPPPRANATLTLADDKNGYLYLLGGEYYDGVENIVLDDLFRWDVAKNEWRQIISPTPKPGPRCAHSTVYYRNALYVLAGELASADQYHHYKDIWKFDLSTMKWEEIQPRATGTAPTARSGHAAFVWKHYMIVFGGFYEALRETRFYNDVCVLDLQSLTWMDIPHSKLASRPEPRSAVNVGLKGDTAIIHGGYSKLKNPTTKAESKVHTDAWLLHLKPILQGKPPTWERLSNRHKGSFSNPSNRSGTASVTYKDRMLIFGGVVDTEEHHHRVDSVFYNELHAFDMERRTWFPVRVKAASKEGKSRRRRKKNDAEDGNGDDGVVEQKDDEDESEDDSDSDLEADIDADDALATSSGWDLDKLRSNMFAFIDGEGKIVYEKIEEENANEGYDADTGEATKSTADVVTNDEAKENDTDEEGEEEAKGDDTDEDEQEETVQKEEVTMKPVVDITKKVGNGNDQSSRGHIVLSSSVMKVNKESGAPEAVARAEPLPRINAAMIVRSNILYVYGGLLEVGDREITLDDCWSFDLRKRDKWNCINEGTMHKQVWRGAVFDDDDSYISTDVGGDDDDLEGSDNELDGDDEDAARAAKAAKKAAKKEHEKSKRAGLRQEISDLKGKLDLDDGDRTPQMGEALAEFYSRTSQYWNDFAASRIAKDTSESEKLSSKELKREGFNLASERYDELKPVLERLDELELQQREAEEERRHKKEKRKGKKG